MLALTIVKISAKSVTVIEQRYTENGRGLHAMLLSEHCVINEIVRISDKFVQYIFQSLSFVICFTHCC
jgi:hypothetical protein